LATGGHVLPSQNADALRRQVLGACSSALTFGGKMYGYPVSAETYALFYNKALVKDNEVPKTWDEVAAFAKKYNAANPGKYGFIMDVGNAYYTIVFTTSDGNRLFGPTGADTSSTNINSPKLIKGMQFFQNLRSVLNVPSADLTTSVADSAFASGTAAMHITGLWNVVPFREPLKTIVFSTTSLL
ncbi:MAG TPA: extracellular solute-binding protein, partial [bacterium]|nr:extracellular solute-binding protein [bacterium]